MIFDDGLDELGFHPNLFDDCSLQPCAGLPVRCQCASASPHANNSNEADLDRVAQMFVAVEKFAASQ